MIKKILSYSMTLLFCSCIFTSVHAEEHYTQNGSRYEENQNCSNDCYQDERFNLKTHLIVAKPYQDFVWVQARRASDPYGQQTFGNLEHDWGWGIAALASFHFCDNWSLGLRYNYIQADGKDAFDASALTAVNDTVAIGHGFDLAIDTPADQVGPGQKGVWGASIDTDMHIIDLIAQFDFCPCEHLIFKPFGGLRFFKLESNYSALLTTAAGAGLPYISIGDGITHDYDLFNYGVVAGFDWEWCLYERFSIIGSILGGALLGDADSSYSLTGSTAPKVGTFYHKLNNRLETNSLIEANIGLAWNVCLFGNELNIETIYETRHLSHVKNPAITTNFNGNNGYGVHAFKFGLDLWF